MQHGSAASRLFTTSIVRRDFRSIAFAYLGCALASSVAVFQFAVFTAFLQASYVPITFIGGDLWVTGRGVEAFDFPYPISSDLIWRTKKCFPDSSLRRVASGFTTYQSPLGERGSVMVVGYDAAPVSERSFVVDRDDVVRLNLDYGNQAEIGRLSMTHEETTDRLKTFLGAPYAVTSLRSAVSALNLPLGSVSFLVVDLSNGDADRIENAKVCANRALGNHGNVLSRVEFSQSSSIYWLMKTGAGAAILIAALLAALLNLIILINGISRTAQRHAVSLLSLLGHGGDLSDVRSVLFQIAVLLTTLTLLTTMIALPIFDLATHWLVPWVTIKDVDILFAVLLTGLGLIVGAISAERQLRRFQVSELFRL